MNFNMDLYEKSEAKEFGDYETLELGGHELVIMDAREYISEQSGKTSLKVSVDIAGKDEQKGFFQKRYDEAKKTDAKAKWSSGGVKYLSLSDEQIGYLKGFITALEKSNPNFKFNLKGKWEQLNNLKIAGQFGLEEFEKQDGTIGTATKLIQFRSLDKLNEIKIPKVRKIDGTLVDYEEYKNTTQLQSTATEIFGDKVVEITDNMLPF